MVRRSRSRNDEPHAQGRFNSTAARRPCHADARAPRGFCEAVFETLFCGVIELAASLIEIVFQFVWQGSIIFFLVLSPDDAIALAV
jgi:hypothetical protein